MGQNFLIDEDVLDEIMSTAELKSSDTVLEVGPGLGVLTKRLLEKSKKVLAVEKDAKLASLLKIELSSASHLQIIQQDILRFNVAENIPDDYKVVANIPYYLTSKLIQNFLENIHPPKLLVLMIQKEVGERVIAEAGDLSILGISVQIYADAEITAQVSKNSFWPVPKVDSVIIKITPKNKYPEITDKKLFFRMIKVAFAGKRKQLHNTLTHGFKLPKEEILDWLEQAGIEPTARPQDLEIGQWIKLYGEISSNLSETK